MAVIVNNCDAVRFSGFCKAALNAGKSRQRFFQIFFRNAQAYADSDRGQSVQNVVSAVNGQGKAVHALRFPRRTEAVGDDNVKRNQSGDGMNILRGNFRLRGKAVGDDLSVGNLGNQPLDFRVIDA